MKRQREEGACYAYSKADGNAYTLQRGEYVRLKADWMAGKAFFTGLAFYGAEMTLRLGDIVAICDTTADHLAAAREDRSADEREDAIE